MKFCLTNMSPILDCSLKRAKTGRSVSVLHHRIPEAGEQETLNKHLRKGMEPEELEPLQV